MTRQRPTFPPIEIDAEAAKLSNFRLPKADTMERIWIETAPGDGFQVWIGRHAARRYFELCDCQEFIAAYLTKKGQPEPESQAQAIIKEYTER